MGKMGNAGNPSKAGTPRAADPHGTVSSETVGKRCGQPQGTVPERLRASRRRSRPVNGWPAPRKTLKPSEE